MKEFKSYCGRERVLLRRRRTKLKVDQFHIIAQVGQGGYGEVYLARKQDSGEVCALKKMRKRTLHKMDEVNRAMPSLHTININHRFAMSWLSEIFLRLPRHRGWFDYSTLFKTPNSCISPWSMFQGEISGRSSTMLVSFMKLILDFMLARCSPVSMSSISLDTSIVTSSLRCA